MSIYVNDPYYFVRFITTVVLCSQIALVFSLVMLIWRWKHAQNNRYLRFLSNHSTVLALLVAITAFCSSMTFSDIFNMVPCKLCVYQRIVIFPQVILLAVALYKKHHDIIPDYSIALTCIAIPLSIFHYMLQMTDAPSVHAFAPCDITGQAPSCSGYYVIQYGYITIPMMALTSSLLILFLMIIRKKLNK